MISYDTEIKIYSAEYEAAVKKLMTDLQCRLVELDEKKYSVWMKITAKNI